MKEKDEAIAIADRWHDGLLPARKHARSHERGSKKTGGVEQKVELV